MREPLFAGASGKRKPLAADVKNRRTVPCGGDSGRFLEERQGADERQGLCLAAEHPDDADDSEGDVGERHNAQQRQHQPQPVIRAVAVRCGDVRNEGGQHRLQSAVCKVQERLDNEQYQPLLGVIPGKRRLPACQNGNQYQYIQVGEYSDEFVFLDVFLVKNGGGGRGNLCTAGGAERGTLAYFVTAG